MTTFKTTTGLRPDGTSEDELPPVAWGIATGTVNALAVTYDPAISGLYDGLIVGVRAAGANTSATVTFNPNGLGASSVVKGGNQALKAGDIAAAGHELLLRYKLSTNKWELLNPYRNGDASAATWAAAAGTVDALTAAFTPPVLSVSDGQSLTVRAAGANLTTTPTFSPDSITARVIKKLGGVALLAGDISASGHELQLRYHDSGTPWWELLNPAVAPAIEAYELFKALNADDTGGTNVNTAQPWFPTAGAVTLAVGTYEFTGLLETSRSAGTTSHTTSVQFGGSLTIGSMIYRANCRTGDANSLAADNTVDVTDANPIVVKAASTSATEQISIFVRGIVRVTVAGTLIPQFIYSAAPGGAPTIKKNSFFRLNKLDASATQTARGTWA